MEQPSEGSLIRSALPVWTRFWLASERGDPPGVPVSMKSKQINLKQKDDLKYSSEPRKSAFLSSVCLPSRAGARLQAFCNCKCDSDGREISFIFGKENSK